MKINNRLREYICSECGKPMYVRDPASYLYKNFIGHARTYQCSYTCWDHAKLRIHDDRYLTHENYIKYVVRCEETMKVQGKEILHPIQI